MKNFNIIAPLPDIRPDWLRKFICVLYFPLITPVLMMALLFFAVIDKVEHNMSTELKIIGDSFYKACWTGVDISYTEASKKYSK
jgi:hypothetical protein